MNAPLTIGTNHAPQGALPVFQEDPRQRQSLGPPSKLTPEAVKKLEEAFAIDATVEEACFYAGISRQTFYNWRRENPALFDTIEALRMRPVLAMRQAAVRLGISSYSSAMDYLSRKRPDEFGNRSKLELGGRVETADVTASEAARKVKDEYEEKLRSTIAAEAAGARPGPRTP
jgi:hypothetical protein